MNSSEFLRRRTQVDEYDIFFSVEFASRLRCLENPLQANEMT
jgi:hypothetical protein